MRMLETKLILSLKTWPQGPIQYMPMGWKQKVLQWLPLHQVFMVGGGICFSRLYSFPQTTAIQMSASWGSEGGHKGSCICVNVYTYQKFKNPQNCKEKNLMVLNTYSRLHQQRWSLQAQLEYILDSTYHVADCFHASIQRQGPKGRGCHLEL